MTETTRERFLVTSALPYANGPVHIGQVAGAYLPADLYCRYLRLQGRDVVYICGSDEMGVAILIRALREDVSPESIVDKYHPMIKEAFGGLGLSFDYYGRTTSDTHRETSQEFFRTLAERDVFELRTEEQLYDPEAKLFLADRFVQGTCPICGFEEAYGDQCEKCGSSLSPTELIDPHSVLTNAAPTLRETTHWYLPLGTMQPQLEEYLGSHPEWKPNVRGQIQSWFNDGLKPRAITRDVPWGVPVPADVAEEAGVDAEGKVIYVWFDAPIGYISATREWASERGSPEAWRDYWQDDESRLIHFIGKDNIVFHGIMFPAMLMAHGDYVVPHNVPANEFLNIESRKLSTSRNWAVWLHEYLEELPPDYLRYVLATTLPETKDADFSWTDYQARVNGELADILGNFINRTLTFAQRYFDGAVPALEDARSVDREMLDALADFPGCIGASYEQFRMREAVAETMNLARLGNKYFNDTEPWHTRKNDLQACANTVHVSLQLCASLSILMEPILPFSAERLRTMLGLTGVRASTPDDGESADSEKGWGAAGKPLLEAGHALEEPDILFEKIEDDTIKNQMSKLESDEKTTGAEGSDEGPSGAENGSSDAGEANAGAADTARHAPVKETIAFDDFVKLDLRVGTVEVAEPITESDKLVRLEVDLGVETRQVLAGVRKHLTPEELIGRKVVVVANLAPREMFGLESQGMLLMSEDTDGALRLIEGAGENGALVR